MTHFNIFIPVNDRGDNYFKVRTKNCSLKVWFYKISKAYLVASNDIFHIFWGILSLNFCYARFQQQPCCTINKRVIRKEWYFTVLLKFIASTNIREWWITAMSKIWLKWNSWKNILTVWCLVLYLNIRRCKSLLLLLLLFFSSVSFLNMVEIQKKTMVISSTELFQLGPHKLVIFLMSIQISVFPDHSGSMTLT